MCFSLLPLTACHTVCSMPVHTHIHTHTRNASTSHSPSPGKISVWKLGLHLTWAYAIDRKFGTAV